MKHYLTEFLMTLINLWKWACGGNMTSNFANEKINSIHGDVDYGLFFVSLCNTFFIVISNYILLLHVSTEEKKN